MKLREQVGLLRWPCNYLVSLFGNLLWLAWNAQLRPRIEVVRSRSCTRNIRNFVSVYGLGTKASLKNLFHKGLQLILKHPGVLFSRGSKDFAAQGFILRRSLYRWIMHICLSGGQFWLLR